MYRRLAAAHPAAHQPDLAMSLSKLSVDLADAGRRDESEGASPKPLNLARTPLNNLASWSPEVVLVAALGSPKPGSDQAQASRGTLTG